MDSKRGKIKIFAYNRVEGFFKHQETNKPVSYLRISLVNIGEKERTITNIGVKYKQITTPFELDRIIKYPLVIQPMMPYDISIPVKKFIDFFHGITPPDSKEHLLDKSYLFTVLVADSTEKTYKSKFVIVCDAYEIDSDNEKVVKDKEYLLYAIVRNKGTISKRLVFITRLIGNRIRLLLNI